VLVAAVLGGALLDGPIRAQVLPPAPPSLKTVPVPEPSNLALFVRNKPAAIALGKALFEMPSPPLHQDPVVRVQLIADGVCWQSDYRPPALRNQGGTFQDIGAP
jgi:hypothetical protein